MSEETKTQRYVCTKCGAIIPNMLNESNGSIEPQHKECPQCNSSSIVLVIETQQPDNRKILYS